MRNSGVEPSAHQTQADEQERWGGLPQLVAEYQQIANEAYRDYNALPDDQKAELLRQRMARGETSNQRMIAGLIPEPTVPMDADLRRALDVRRDAIEQRVTDLAHRVLLDKPAWLIELGPQPLDRLERDHWDHALRVVVAYRDTHAITGDAMLGGAPTTRTQSDHRAEAHRTIRRLFAQRLVTADQLTAAASPSTGSEALRL